MPKYAIAVDDFLLPTVWVLTSESTCGSPLASSGWPCSVLCSAVAT